jgi:hypothetical protein
MTARGVAEKYTGRVQSDGMRLEPGPATLTLMTKLPPPREHHRDAVLVGGRNDL